MFMSYHSLIHYSLAQNNGVCIAKTSSSMPVGAYPTIYGSLMEVKILSRAIPKYTHREYALSVCHSSRFEHAYLPGGLMKLSVSSGDLSRCGSLFPAI